MGIILTFVIFGIIVTFHEFGHFIIAKRSGIKVLEFSVGMGPRLYTYHGKETKYSLKLLPLGGSCLMLGEDATEEKLEGSFNSVSVGKRLATVFAGPLFNFILAFFFSIIIITSVGVDKAYVTGVTEGYPAKEVGIQAGDLITKVNNQKVVVYRDFILYLYMNPGEEVEIEVLRNQQKQSFKIIPKFNAEQNRYLIGIENGTGNEKLNGILEIISYSLYEVWYNISATLKGLQMMLYGTISANDISGPVGIVGVIGETVNETKQYGALVVFLTVCNMIVLFSANLGVMNLLPIPALDGGRILFLLTECIMGRPLNRKAEGYIHFAGFVLLMCLMGFVMFNDIRKLIGL